MAQKQRKDASFQRIKAARNSNEKHKRDEDMKLKRK